jgi:hypothetical protein
MQVKVDPRLGIWPYAAIALAIPAMFSAGCWAWLVFVDAVDFLRWLAHSHLCN